MANELEHNEGKIVDVDVREEMKNSFLDYAMSVIISRALPDARDGLKPVHRRILFAMYELNMYPNKAFKKSARLVGEVLGKFHPHGDSSIYDAMVRMAQEFSTRYQMVDGQGNFGSIDDDPPAAMRYTEARMSKVATAMLEDIDSDTIDFVPNFDGTLKEPVVLPTLIPNLIINGTTGIAVGMATNIPPHNLTEVMTAILHMIDNKDATNEDLMEFVKGPDFPTGGTILGRKGIQSAYTTGKGSVPIRSVIEIEENERGRTALVVKEIPFQISKRRIVEQIANLVQDKKIEGISDLRDESDKDGIRIVIELKRDGIPKVVLNNLYKHSLLQSNFSANILAILKGKPEVLDLRKILKAYIEHRIEVVTRRTKYFLDKALARDHIVQGLLIVQQSMDEVIKVIQKSASSNEAHEKLIQNYQLTAIQATEVLDMQLRRLTALEKQKLENEHMALLEKITDFKDILGSQERIDEIIRIETQGVLDKYGDERKTQIIADPGEFSYQDLIPNEKMAIFITDQGYIKRVQLDEFENQKRGGKGKGGLTTRDKDFVKHFFISSNHRSVLFFTNTGLVHSLKVYEIPETSRVAKGSSVANLLPLSKKEYITAVIQVEEFEEDAYLMMLTKKGMIKRTILSEYQNIRANGKIAISLNEGDELGWVSLSTGNSEILIGTNNGYAIRFTEDNVRPTGRKTKGVIGIRLRDSDKVVGFYLAPSSEGQTEEVEVTEEENDNLEMPQLLTVTTDGYGKRTPISAYRLQSRGGLGVINIKLREKSEVATVICVRPEDEVIIASLSGIIIRQKVEKIPSTSGRSTKGVRLQRVDTSKDRVISTKLVIKTGDEDEDDIDNENINEEFEENSEIENLDTNDENNEVDSIQGESSDSNDE